ncbi:hypothetical protein Acsp04_17970 [Actinomadura sp. NBRC 104425]|uniref:hypothetical protein n=1 Tax=Actinomadura sp. NBRC 104425 TaxID=3032204 RepID=UPI0024A2AB45|nr:hypothetical protein [Actinomadura sp. NBRC 104425]GLZ11562.1 hypothetical protein Acsp04_17970 [Actinomadura sp. NBRC 104425]
MDGKRGEEERPPCPHCGGRLAPIMYGLPVFSEELDRALDAGEVMLGGCELDSYRWGCPQCGERYIDAPEEDRPTGSPADR